MGEYGVAARAAIEAMRAPPFEACKEAGDKIGMAYSVIDLCFNAVIDTTLKAQSPETAGE